MITETSPPLMYVKDVYGRRYRVNKQDLDGDRADLPCNQTSIPLYNQFGRKLSDTSNKNRKYGYTRIHRGNIIT